LYDTVIALVDGTSEFATQIGQHADKGSNLRNQLHGERVLLVEDNPINQELAADLLKILGASVTVADNGDSAIASLHAQRFDLVLMDIQMPKMDGLQATQIIRETPSLRDLPVIAMTANAMPGDRERCLAAGMDDYISKPIDPTRLLQVLQFWLHKNGLHKTKANVAVDPTQQKMEEPMQHATEASALVAKLKAAGFNTDRALPMLMDQHSLYFRLLRRFFNERANAAHTVNATLRRGDIEAAIIDVHALKSVAAALGADELEKVLAEFEAALKNHQPYDSLIPRFEASLNAYITPLASVVWPE
jgi:CheY-like chemotaxis protein/HPt (histidine-containing phosphotransfer) domain-containing protein